MFRSPSSPARTGRRIFVVGLVVALGASGAYWLYSPAGDNAPASSAGPRREETPVPPPSTAPASPSSELAAALADQDLSQRSIRVRNALQNWARLAPEAAAKWVLTQRPEVRLVDASVVLIALADRPEEALRTGTFFCREDPTYVREHGNSLIAVLTATGEFSRALDFATLGGPERSDWVARTFSGWAELAPAAAAQAALAFEGDDAVSVVFATWAAGNRAAAARALSGATDSAAAQRAALVALARGSPPP